MRRRKQGERRHTARTPEGEGQGGDAAESAEGEEGGEDAAAGAGAGAAAGGGRGTQPSGFAGKNRFRRFRMGS